MQGETSLVMYVLLLKSVKRWKSKKKYVCVFDGLKPKLLSKIGKKVKYYVRT